MADQLLPGSPKGLHACELAAEDLPQQAADPPGGHAVPAAKQKQQKQKLVKQPAPEKQKRPPAKHPKQPTKATKQTTLWHQTLTIKVDDASTAPVATAEPPAAPGTTSNASGSATLIPDVPAAAALILNDPRPADLPPVTQQAVQVVSGMQVVADTHSSDFSHVPGAASDLGVSPLTPPSAPISSHTAVAAAAAAGAAQPAVDLHSSATPGQEVGASSVLGMGFDVIVSWAWPTTHSTGSTV